MSVEADLRALLVADAAVSALVEEENIYPLHAPQGVSNATTKIVYELHGGQTTRSLTGRSGQENGNYEFHCMSELYDTAKSIAQAVRDVLDCFQGVVGATTFQGIFAEIEEEAEVPASPASEKTIKEFSVTATVWYDRE